MSQKPIFVATHPRACSTAFERVSNLTSLTRSGEKAALMHGLQVFMTRRHSLTCIHEPFGDAFYFGPERLSDRYEHDEKARKESGFGESTYRTVVDILDRESVEV
jgi:hypothetical protein